MVRWAAMESSQKSPRSVSFSSAASFACFPAKSKTLHKFVRQVFGV